MTNDSGTPSMHLPRDARSFLVCPLNAQAALPETDAWICNYNFGSKEANREIKSRFELRDGVLVETDLQQNDFDFSGAYKILQNTRDAIVAAVANKDIDPDPVSAVLGVLVVILHKPTGGFQIMGAGLGQLPVQYSGRCDLDVPTQR